jgi:hypothetical protein
MWINNVIIQWFVLLLFRFSFLFSQKRACTLKILRWYHKKQNSWWASQHKNAWEPWHWRLYLHGLCFVTKQKQRLTGKSDCSWRPSDTALFKMVFIILFFDSFLIYWVNWQPKSLIWIWGHHMFTYSTNLYCVCLSHWVRCSWKNKKSCLWIDIIVLLLFLWIINEYIRSQSIN